MRIIIFVVSLFFVVSCSNSGNNKQLSGCDSLVINFNIPKTNTIEKTMTTTESKAIKKLTRFVSGKSTETLQCGYDGNLVFYKQGALMGDVSFNYSGEGCRHFVMIVGDKLTSTTMSNEGADFLKSLAEGKSWY